MKSDIRAMSFRGGYRFKPFQGEIGGRTIIIPLPNEIVIPLKQGYGVEVPPLVTKRDKVIAGTIIGKDDNSLSSPVHASVNGIIRDITSRNIGGTEVNSVVIDCDGSPGWENIPRKYSDYRSAGAEQIEKAIYESGVSSLGKYGIPTKYNTSAIGPDGVKKIVISAIFTEPFILNNRVLLSNSIQQLIIGCDILRILYRPDEIHLGIGNNDLDLVNKLHSELSELNIHVHALVPKHPHAFEEIIVESCLGVVVPDRGRVIDKGILVLNAQTVLNIHDAVVEGKPLIERTIALGGGAYSEPCAAAVRVGTTIADITADRIREGIEPRFILDSAITGNVIAETSEPLCRDAFALIALEELRDRLFLHFVRPGGNYDSKSWSFLSRITNLPRRSDTNLSGEPRACISCGYCVEVCPRDLFPYHLSKCVRAQLPDEAEKARIFGCIECGLCSYVCPSKIPIMDDLRKGKEIILQEEEEIRRNLEAAELERRNAEETAAGEISKDA